MEFILMLLLALCGSYISVYVAYQSLLFAANAFVPDHVRRTPSQQRRFAVLLPAHNEEIYLPRLLSSLDAQTYAHDRFRVYVIADNCTDATATAAARFDVEVLTRTEPTQRGKGHAIGWALDRIDLASFDAVIVVDSDSVVDRAFIASLNDRMDLGERVVQAYNGVANPAQSWFTRLLNISRIISNDILHPGKAKLGLSSDLMGNGMCFHVEVLKAHPWSAFSVAEDWEYYVRLVLSGVHIGYARDARVFHQESIDLEQASSQRMRWSGGKFQMLRRHAPRLFMAGLTRRSLACFDAALSLALPNPSLAMNLTLLGLLIAIVGAWLGGPVAVVGWFGALAVVQVLMFVAGVLRTENKAASAMSIVIAPAFLVWKMGIDILSLCGFGATEWKPTKRVS